MATTYTPNYNLAQPEVGGEPDTWGGLLNADLGTLDTVIKAISDVANAALPKAGGTMTGPLTLQSGQYIALNNTAAGSYHPIRGQVGGLQRWEVNLGDNSAESGSNAGSNFAIFRYNDAGGSLGSPLSISRATGLVTLGNSLSVAADANIGGSAVVAGNLSTNNGVATFATPGGGQLRLNDTSGATAYLRAGASFLSAGDGIGWFMSSGGNFRFVDGTSAGATVRVGQLRVTAQAPMHFDYAGGSTIYIWGQNGAGDDMMNVARVGTSNYNFTFNGRGYAVDFQSTSDARLKSDVEPLTDGVERLKQMRPRSYRKQGQPEVGFIAQEVERVLNTAVSTREDGFLAVSPGQIGALIAAALLEVEARVSALEDLI